jgi:ABC-type sugar transport system ATPase subunit
MGYRSCDERGPARRRNSRNLQLGEARVHALRGVCVEIRRAEFVAIMGASGSGKSTFMNMLGCLNRPSSGRYLLDGIDVSEHNKKTLALIRNQRIGFVFQGFKLLALTTALENRSCRLYMRRSVRASAKNALPKRSRWWVLPIELIIFPRKGQEDSNESRLRAGESSVDLAGGRADRKSRQPDIGRDHGDFPES